MLRSAVRGAGESLATKKVLVGSGGSVELVEAGENQRVEVYGFLIAVANSNGPNLAVFYDGNPDDSPTLGYYMQLYTEPHTWIYTGSPIYTTSTGKSLWLKNESGDDQVLAFVVYRIVE